MLQILRKHFESIIIYKYTIGYSKQKYNEKNREEINAKKTEANLKCTLDYNRSCRHRLNMEDDINEFVGHTVIHYLRDMLFSFATCIIDVTANRLCIKYSRTKLIEKYHTK